MSDQEGPVVWIRMSCRGCRYHSSERYHVQSDSGYDHRCSHPEGPAHDYEPAWPERRGEPLCPLLPTVTIARPTPAIPQGEEGRAGEDET